MAYSIGNAIGDLRCSVRDLKPGEAVESHLYVSMRISVGYMLHLRKDGSGMTVTKIDESTNDTFTRCAPGRTITLTTE